MKAYMWLFVGRISLLVKLICMGRHKIYQSSISWWVKYSNCEFCYSSGDYLEFSAYHGE